MSKFEVVEGDRETSTATDLKEKRLRAQVNQLIDACRDDFSNAGIEVRDIGGVARETVAAFVKNPNLVAEDPEAQRVLKIVKAHVNEFPLPPATAGAMEQREAA